MKLIVVTGGVLSGLGKGIAAASIGHLLSAKYKVTPVKCDGYLNVDPGTINPYEHGEVFVLEDGGEVDMDFGHYERFMKVNCKADWSLTMGKVFLGVIQKERKGEYLGEDVQLIPHVTDHIKDKLKEIGKETDILMIEVGGTVGDIESELFIQAARQLAEEVGKENSMFVHLTYVPKPPMINEQKTKPTQQSVQRLRERGIAPDVIITRAEDPVPDNIKQKIKLFCGSDMVVSGHDIPDVYIIPQNYHKQGLLDYINKRLDLQATYDDTWEKLTDNLQNLTKEVTIGIAGKYTSVEDSYASIIEALKHCSAHTGVKVNVRWVETTEDGNIADDLKGVDGVIVPGGFGSRGIEGKIKAVQYCREQNIPYLGICYGMQLAVVEFARNVCGLEKANTTEVDKETKYPVIDILPEQKQVTQKGATMRLGAYPATLVPGIIRTLYGQEDVSERHRHRFEVNPEFHKQLQDNGMLFSGMNKHLVEFMELPNHKYFVGTQAHPELKSTLSNPAPLFLGLVKAAAQMPL